MPTNFSMSMLTVATMRYARVYIDALEVELPTEVITMRYHENQLAPLLKQLQLPIGHIEAITGISERRFWPDGASLVDGAQRAARRALDQSGVKASDLGALIYTSVCREHFEPATACLIAGALEVPPNAMVYDLSNACLGALNGIIELANHIELGHFRAGLVIACESARPIIEQTIKAMLKAGTAEFFAQSVATMTGGSGAVAILVTDGSFAAGGHHQLLGGVVRSASQHHDLCRWGYTENEDGSYIQSMTTDARAVLHHGLDLGRATWRAFLQAMDWEPQSIDRTITHQVGRTHRQKMLNSIERSIDQDYPTFQHLGNIGSVSVPLTASLAAANGFIQPGHRVAWLGIGSGLNCLMLGIQW